MQFHRYTHVNARRQQVNIKCLCINNKQAGTSLSQGIQNHKNIKRGTWFYLQAT